VDLESTSALRLHSPVRHGYRRKYDRFIGRKDSFP
jgi:hypothetical protein